MCSRIDRLAYMHTYLFVVKVKTTIFGLKYYKFTMYIALFCFNFKPNENEFSDFFLLSDFNSVKISFIHLSDGVLRLVLFNSE